MKRFGLCWREQLLNKRKVTIKRAMKKTFWKHSMAHLLNKNKALSNLSLSIKIRPKKATRFRVGLFFLYWSSAPKFQNSILVTQQMLLTERKQGRMGESPLNSQKCGCPPTRKNLPSRLPQPNFYASPTKGLFLPH